MAVTLSCQVTELLAGIGLLAHVERRKLCAMKM